NTIRARRGETSSASAVESSAIPGDSANAAEAMPKATRTATPCMRARIDLLPCSGCAFRVARRPAWCNVFGCSFRRTGRTDAFASADSPAYVSDISVDLRAKETLDTLLLHAVAGRLLLGHDRRARRSTLRLAHVLDARALDLGDCLVAKPGKMRRECAGVEKGLLVRGLAALQRDDDVRSRNAARMQPAVVSPRGAEGEHVVVPRAAADPDRSPRGRTKAAVRASDPLLLARAHRPPARAAPRLVQDLLHLGARLRLPEARFQ